VTPHQAMEELIEYLESKRNSAILASKWPSEQQPRIKAEADAYDDALTAARDAMSKIK
jgi:hypothetical protein